MAVIAEVGQGWLVDQAQMINCVTSGVKLQLRRGLFKVCLPYLKSRPQHGECSNKQDSKLSHTGPCHYNSQGPLELKEESEKKRNRVKRKRVRKSQKNHGEILAEQYHNKCKDFIKAVKETLTSCGGKMGYFGTCDEHGCSKELYVQIEDKFSITGLVTTAKNLPRNLRHDRFFYLNFDDAVVPDGVNCMIKSDFENTTIRTIFGRRYIIPWRSCFLISDIGDMDILTQYGKKYDVIVMDPPWENKSIKRAKKYETLPSSKMLTLPLGPLMEDNCLVIVWVTNKSRYIRFVKEELFPKWNIKHLTDWFWVKVTHTGNFVIDLDSPHKKPYEVIVIGRKYAEERRLKQDSPVPGDPLAEQKVIVSIPSIIHSWKPSLNDVLKRILPHGFHALELFARNLTPGWTSWGNEAIKFQSCEYFSSLDTKDEMPRVDPARCSTDNELADVCHPGQRLVLNCGI